ncbi:MAG: transposase [Bryobacterales bacterium]|nr:transposase [Bryobacterales bacterium]
MPSAPKSSPAPRNFFASPLHPHQRRYELLRAFFHDGLSAAEVGRRFGLAPSSVYSLTRNFRQLDNPAETFFLPAPRRGRPPLDPAAETRRQIIALRRQNLSVPDIKARLDATCEQAPSERTIDRVLKEAGFTRLPRRTRAQRREEPPAPIEAPCSLRLAPSHREQFQCESAAGVLCLLPLIRHFGLDRAIDKVGFPGSATLPPLQSVLAFLALKCASVRRYACDDLWCMDRGLGLFAGLNVLPKTAWMSSYSDRVTRSLNQSLLGSLAKLWKQHELTSETANLDFTTLPHWGDDKTLQKHWSGTRNRALVGLSAALAQDPDSGLILRADASIRRQSSSEAVIEFLDFFRRHGQPVRFLAFDSRFTTYRQLARLDQDKILFVTVRRRGKRLLKQARSIPPDEVRKVRVPLHHGSRIVRAHSRRVHLPGYDGQLRQITVLPRPHSRRRPSLLLTNDFECPLAEILRRYARRWLVEKSISEQLAFFHLNRLSSSMVIKVDFDLTLTALAYNLYRLLALQLPPGFQRHTATTLFEKLLATGADVTLTPTHCRVALKKKRNLPALLETLDKLPTQSIPWLGNRKLIFQGATRT